MSICPPDIQLCWALSPLIPKGMSSTIICNLHPPITQHHACEEDAHELLARAGSSWWARGEGKGKGSRKEKRLKRREKPLRLVVHRREAHLVPLRLLCLTTCQPADSGAPSRKKLAEKMEQSEMSDMLVVVERNSCMSFSAVRLR